MLLRGFTRMKADQAVDTGDIEGALTNWLDARGSRDILVLTAPIDGQTYKMAPKLAHLQLFTDLATELVTSAPNTLLGLVGVTRGSYFRINNIHIKIFTRDVSILQ